MKKYISIILISLAVASSSCKKTYLQELGTNPNTPSSATPDLLLSGSLGVAVNIPNHYYQEYASWVGYVSWNSTNYQENHQLEAYQFTTGDYDVWTPIYENLGNWNQLQTNPLSSPNYVAIAMIMSAFDFQQLVDNYNDVPYSQALQGTKVLTPKFDKGSDVYDGLMKQLDAAITLIGKSDAAAKPSTADFMFAGDMTKWAKFANTLKLRLAIRQWDNVSSKQAALKTAITATSALGYIDATFDAEANPGYLSSDANGGKQSPFWLDYGLNAAGGTETNHQEYCANLYAINYFTDNNDPRLTQVYAIDAQGEISGLPFGSLAQEPDGSTPSVYGPGLLISPTMNAVIMNSAESLFLQAEAVNDGLITGDAETLYNAGVTASFTSLLVPNASNAAGTYLTQASVAYPTGGTIEQQKQAIITQKWAALFGYEPLEAYNEFRRTGYPNNIPLSITPGATAPNNVSRIFYPIIAFETNSANASAEPAVNIFSSTIFWAKVPAPPVK